ncbi:MAG: aminotransferase class III-fold pyridoxal phosphate-dependent enzyme [Dehalococcoidales bacterium]
MKKVSQRTENFLKIDREHIIHSICVVGQNSGLVIEKAYGIYLVDTDGKEYIDLASGNCCCNLGHGRKEIIDAVTTAINQTDFSTSFYGHSNTYIIECSQKLAGLTPGDLNHFYFTSGGSESVDTAIKIARLYWSNKGRAGKYKIISLYDSYHGASGFSTYTTGTGLGSMQDAFGPAPPGLMRIPSYYCYRCTYGLNYPECDLQCARMLGTVIQAEGAGSVAAFIAEPMIGGGGFFEPPSEWWPIVSETCRNNDVLLIADEVLSGFTRTGKMFAVENWDIHPDIMTIAKGITSAYLPFGAAAISNEVYEALKGKIFTHGFTYSGHAIPAAAACAALDIYVKDKIAENAAKVGNHIKQRLDAEFSPLPCVGNIGGMGINYAVELIKDKRTRTAINPDTKTELIGKLLENGIYTRCLGRLGNRLHIGPPCTTTIEEADKALDIIQPLVAQLKVL